MAITPEHSRAIGLMQQAQNATNEAEANRFIAQAQQAAQNAGPSAAQVFAAVTNHAQEIQARNVSLRPTTPETGGGGGGGGGQQSEADKAQAAYYNNLNAQLNEENRQARLGAKAFLRNILTQYGMESLIGDVDRLIGDFGTNTEVIAEQLTQTDQYKTRFRGMLALQGRGIADVRNEAQYLQLESNYRRVFRENNLSEYLGTSGTDEEYGKIADLVGDFSLSVNEVEERIMDAQRVVADTPQEVRNSLSSFYNIQADALVGYVLDPDKATTEINRMANAALIGGTAAQGSLDFGRATSERIAGAFAGDQDLNADAFRTRVTGIAEQRDATSRLADLEKATLSDDEVALAELDLDPAAKKKVRGLQSRERARFSGSSAITSGTLSRRGGY